MASIATPPLGRTSPHMATGDVYSEELWQRFLVKAEAIGKREAWEQAKPTNYSAGGVLVQFSAYANNEIVNIEASTDHVIRFLLRLGLSENDTEDFARSMDLTTRRIRVMCRVKAMDALVWLLEMPPFDLCGQTIRVKLSGDVVQTIAHFFDKSRRNAAHLPEAKFLARCDNVLKYLPANYNRDEDLSSFKSEVYIWGEHYGSKPTVWTGITSRVVQACCGDRHAIFLTDVGRVITTGDSAQGQCGNGPSWGNVTSHNVVMPAIVTQIAAGNTYSLALTESNNVYFWGTCKFSAPSGPMNLPAPAKLFQSNMPQLWDSLKRTNIVQVASGAAHILFLTKENKVLSVGNPTQGRLGRAGSYFLPLPVETLNDHVVTKIACGYANSVAFCAGTSQIFVWGRNEKMECGIDDPALREIALPVELDGFKDRQVSDIVCGFSDSYAITDKGPYRWGRTAPMLMDWFQKNLKSVSKIAVGMAHTLALGPQGEVYSWGISPLGQCGHDDTFTYVLPTRIYDLPPSVGGIAAAGHLSVAFTGALRTPLSQDFEKCVNNAHSFPDVVFHIRKGDHIDHIVAHRAMIVARAHELPDQTLSLLLSGSPAQKKYYKNASIFVTTSLKRKVFTESIPNANEKPADSPLVIDLSFTSNGTEVQREALLCVLTYIYADYIIPIPPEAMPSALDLCEDFGLPRLSALLTRAADPPPSTYLTDLDILIPIPSEHNPLTPNEEAWAKSKPQAAALVGAFSDLSLVPTDSNTTIYAHRFVMCVRSEFFRTLLSENMVEAKERIVNLETDDSTLKWLLRFIYTDAPCVVDVNITVELLKLAAMLQLERLVYLCSRFIEKELDDETTLYMYHLTSTHSIKALQDICWSLMVRNWDAVTATAYWKDNLSEDERVSFGALHDAHVASNQPKLTS